MSQDLFANSPFGVIPQQMTEEAMIEQIRERVQELMDTNADLLFSYLYRLDVLEHKIKGALRHPTLPADEALAQLIWERQKQRLQTKKDYQSKFE